MSRPESAYSRRGRQKFPELLATLSECLNSILLTVTGYGPGWFRPNAADALAAGFNPRLAVWSHNPFAVEAEQHIVMTFAGRFGLPSADVDDTFTSGAWKRTYGLLTALTDTLPSYSERGIRASHKQPVMNLSS
jgi:glutamate/tyrosine decarboxylase-like PLP-dependent enzyme